MVCMIGNEVREKKGEGPPGDEVRWMSDAGSWVVDDGSAFRSGFDASGRVR